MIEMPKELRSADVNSESENTVEKLSQVQSLGRKVGVEPRNVAGFLNDSDTIHASGNRAHSRMSDAPNRPPGAGLAGGCHQPPLTWDRSVLKPLMKMKAMTTTVRNSRTEMAEPAPRFTSVTFCR